MENKGFQRIFENVDSILKKYDLFIVNLVNLSFKCNSAVYPHVNLVLIVFIYFERY